jgi:uncharacterized protein (DUF169 family)
MPNYADLDKTFTKHLGLDRAPVAVSFLDAPPSGVRKFMGQAPSACSFWRIAATAPAGKSAFYVVPSDLFGCAIGTYTHNVPLPADRAHELDDTLGLMASIGYVKMDEVPQIPVWPKTPAAVAYARLGDAKVAPDVVIFSGKPWAITMLAEAARSAGKASSLPPLPRPTCMAIPAAAGYGATVSFGCIGNRVYTEVPEDHIYMMVKGADLEAIASALATIKTANDKLDAYHTERKPGLTRPDSTA